MSGRFMNREIYGGGQAAPTLALSTPIVVTAATAAGTVISTISNVPAGATPAISPADGRLVIAGSAGAGWSVVRGLSAVSEGTIPFTVSAAGAVGAAATVTVAGATALQALTWSPLGGRMFEGNAAGRNIGTPQGKTAGSTLSIVGVETWNPPIAGAPAIAASKTTVSTSLISTDGTSLLTGSSALGVTTGSAVGVYLATVRETLDGSTRDTVMPVIVHALPKAGALYSDDFSTGSTLLRNAPGWMTALIGGTNANQDNAVITGGRLQITGAGTSNRLLWYRPIGSTDGEISFTHLASGVVQYIWARYTSPTNFIRLSLNAAGTSLSLAKRSTSSGALNTLVSFPNPLGSTTPFTASDRFGVRFIGTRAFLLLNNAIVASSSGYDVSDVPPIDQHGFVSDDTAGAVALFDNLQMQALVGFSVQALQKVYAFDWTTNMAGVPLCGGLGLGQTGVEWRLLKDDGSTVSGYDWADLAPTTDLTARTWSRRVALPRPSGIYNYRVQLRDPANPSTTVIASADFGVGLITVPDGQSNMARPLSSAVGATAIYTTGIEGKVWVMDPQAVNPTSAAGKPFASYLAQAAAAFQCPVLAISGARGGHPVAELKPFTVPPGDHNTAAPFDEMLWSLYRFAGRISNIIIDQGESDSGSFVYNSPTFATTWINTWKDDILAALARSLGQSLADIPVGIALSYGETTDPATTGGAYLELRKAQTALAAALPQGFVSHHKFDIPFNSGVDYDSPPADTIHQKFMAQYQKLMGRFVASLAKKKGLATTDRRGPVATGMTRSGQFLDVTFDLNGATGLAIDAGTIRGWQAQLASSAFTNAGATLALDATTPFAIVGGNVLRIKLAADPGAPVSLRYPMFQRQISSAWYYDAKNPHDLTPAAGQLAGPQIRGTGYAPDYQGGTTLDATSGTIGVFPILEGLTA